MQAFRDRLSIYVYFVLIFILRFSHTSQITWGFMIFFFHLTGNVLILIVYLKSVCGSINLMYFQFTSFL